MSMAHARNQSLGRNIAVGLTLTGPALSRLLGGDLKKRARRIEMAAIKKPLICSFW